MYATDFVEKQIIEGSGYSLDVHARVKEKRPRSVATLLYVVPIFAPSSTPSFIFTNIPRSSPGVHHWLPCVLIPFDR